MLLVAATPIGNLGDASPRLQEALASADLIAAEDTRNVRALADKLGVQLTAQVVSFHEHNEQGRQELLVSELQAGSTVLVVSDAGMPALSDPGFNLIAAAHDQGIKVQVIPGPSAITTAVVASGFATDRFTYEGFLHRKPGPRRQQLQEARDLRRTAVFFDSPYRIADSLQQVVEVYGAEHPVSVCRELTKKFEEIRRGPAEQVRAWAQGGVKGEITLVLAPATSPANEPTRVDLDDVARRALSEQEAGQRLKTAAQQLGQQHGYAPKQVYDRALQLRAEEN